LGADKLGILYPTFTSKFLLFVSLVFEPSFLSGYPDSTVPKVGAIDSNKSWLLVLIPEDFLEERESWGTYNDGDVLSLSLSFFFTKLLMVSVNLESTS